MTSQFKKQYFYLIAIFFLLVYLVQNLTSFDSVFKLIIMAGWLFAVARFKFQSRITFLIALFMLLPAALFLALNFEVVAVQIGTFIYIFLGVALVQKFGEIIKENRNEIQ